MEKEQGYIKHSRVIRISYAPGDWGKLWEHFKLTFDAIGREDEYRKRVNVTAVRYSAVARSWT